jgi:hypothetical protein
MTTLNHPACTPLAAKLFDGVCLHGRQAERQSTLLHLLHLKDMSDDLWLLILGKLDLRTVLALRASCKHLQERTCVDGVQTLHLQAGQAVASELLNSFPNARHITLRDQHERTDVSGLKEYVEKLMAHSPKLVQSTSQLTCMYTG